MTNRYDVQPLLSNYGDAGWSVYDKVEGRFTGGWHLYQEAAELTAQVMNEASRR